MHSILGEGLFYAYTHTHTSTNDITTVKALEMDRKITLDPWCRRRGDILLTDDPLISIQSVKLRIRLEIVERLKPGVNKRL